MSLGINGLDHVVIRVSDLDASETLYRRLGFTLTPRGFHVGRGSANHTAPLSGGNYFELIHIEPTSVRDHFFPDHRGAVAIALAPDDSRALHVEITRLGYDVEPPRDLARPVDLPRGAREARFLNATLPRIGPDAVRWFACQHLTRDLVWRPEWEGHANGATRLTEAILVHPTPEALGPAYRGLFQGLVHVEPDSLRVIVGDDTISVLTPAKFSARFPGIPLSRDTSQGWFAGVALRVRSTQTTAEFLSQAGVPTTRTPVGAVVVAPSEAAGVLFEFSGD